MWGAEAEKRENKGCRGAIKGGGSPYLVSTQRASPPPQSSVWAPLQGMLHDELRSAVARLTVDELEQKHSVGKQARHKRGQFRSSSEPPCPSKGGWARTRSVLDAGLVEALAGAELRREDRTGKASVAASHQKDKPHGERARTHVGAHRLRHGRARGRRAVKQPAVLAVAQADLGLLPAVGQRLGRLVGGRRLEDHQSLAATAELGVIAAARHRALVARVPDRDRVGTVALCEKEEREGAKGRGEDVSPAAQGRSTRREARRTAAVLDAGVGKAAVGAV